VSCRFSRIIRIQGSDDGGEHTKVELKGPTVFFVTRPDGTHCRLVSNVLQISLRETMHRRTPIWVENHVGMRGGFSSASSSYSSDLSWGCDLALLGYQTVRAGQPGGRSWEGRSGRWIRPLLTFCRAEAWRPAWPLVPILWAPARSVFVISDRSLVTRSRLHPWHELVKN